MTNTPKKEWERLYPIVEPLVEKMRAKYPPELNIDGFEPALTQDIVEIVDTVITSRDEALIAGLEKLKEGCPIDGDQAINEAIALVRGSKET